MYRIARNTLILGAGQAAAIGSAMLFGLLVARRLGPETYGVYSMTFAFVGMFTILFSLGLDQTVVREVSRRPESGRNVLRMALVLRVTALPIALAIILLAARLSGYGARLQHLIALIALATGLSTLADVPRLYFQGLQHPALDSASRVMEKGIALLVAVVCLHLRPDLAFALVALVVGATAGLVTCWLLLHRLPIKPPGRGLSGGRILLRQSAPLLGSLAVIGVTSRLPVVLLSRFRPAGEVGLYSAAFSLVDPLSLVAMAAATAILPVASGLLHNKDNSIFRLNESLLAGALLVGLPATAGLALFGSDLLALVYGQAYTGAALPMAILAFSLLCYSLAVCLHVYLIAAGAQSRFLLVTVVQLVVSVVTNLILGPRFGAAGTAASVAATQLSGLVLIVCYTAPLAGFRLNRKGISAAVATLLMIAGVTAASALPFWARAALALCLYVLGLQLTAGLTLSEVWRGLSLLPSLFRLSERPSTAGTSEKSP